VALTQQGRNIAERAKFLLTDAEDLERESKLSGLGTGGRIRFGMVPMPARALLGPVLSDRMNLAPAVTYEVVVRDVEALWSMLLAGEIEFFISHRRPQDLSLAKVGYLASFPLGLIVGAHHPLLHGAEGDARFPLVRSSWTGVAVPSEVHDRVLGAPNIVEDFGALAEMTLSTDAIWLTSAYAVQPQLRDGTLVEFLRFEQQIEVVCYSLKRRTQSPLAHVLLAGLQQHLGLLSSGLDSSAPVIQA